jgi:hypothetical protein
VTDAIIARAEEREASHAARRDAAQQAADAERLAQDPYAFDPIARAEAREASHRAQQDAARAAHGARGVGR